MNPDHIAAWREYLAGQMHEQFGVGRQDARKAVTRWLQSLQGAAPEAYQVPEAARSVRTRPAVAQARSARA